jgi:hypothetical protein
MSRTLAARVRFLRPEEGGFSRPPLAGVQPLLRIGSVFTSTIVRPLDPEVLEFEFGRDYHVSIEVRFWEDYGHLMQEGMPVQLFDGKRQIGEGAFLDPIRS